MKLIDGSFYAPFFVFIKDKQKRSDHEVLKMLGYNKYQLVKNHKIIVEGISLFITSDDNWLHIMDSWTYNLWHDKNIRGTLENLAANHDIFYCHIGDTDHEYGFTYYKNGKLIRKLNVSYPNYQGPKIEENFGEKIKGESPQIVLNGEREEVLSIARELGINLDHNIKKINQYFLHD